MVFAQLGVSWETGSTKTMMNSKSRDSPQSLALMPPQSIFDWLSTTVRVYSGPAGPTAFWKISDDIVEEKENPFGGTNAWQEIINLVFEQNND